MSADYCAGCGAPKKLAAKGLCSCCYKQYRAGTLFDLLGSNIPAGRGRWTPFEDGLIKNLWGAERPVTIWRRVNELAGHGRSLVAIMVRAGRLDLDYRTTHGQFTIEEIATTLGLGRWHIDRLVKAGTVNPIGKGKCKLITAEDFERIAELYPPPPANAISKTVAMQRLGYCESHMTRLLIAGVIRGVRRGERWFVDADHVTELVEELKASGETRKVWGDHPALEADRARNREYARTKRKQARQEARREVWYTQNDARHVLDVGRDEMRRLLETGAVRGKRENYLWLAERAHVDELAAARRSSIA